MGMVEVCGATIGEEAGGCMDQKITLPLNVTREKRGVLAGVFVPRIKQSAS
jgi:hypothetical protein